MKIAIIANGNVEKEISSVKDWTLICADGGADHAHRAGLLPDYVIGDMDSISKPVLKYMKEHTKVIVDSDQDKTDTELALELASRLGATEIIMLGCTGNRIDHTIANILCMLKAPCKVKMIDSVQEMFVAEDYTELSGKGIVSVIPLEDINRLKYQGLKWGYDRVAPFGWFGICNEIVDKRGIIALSNGRALIIRVNEPKSN